MIAEIYEKDPQPGGKTVEHVAHCKAIAKDYAPAAHEAEALALEDRGMLPHGVVR